jgi:hypothetical protein
MALQAERTDAQAGRQGNGAVEQEPTHCGQLQRLRDRDHAVQQDVGGHVRIGHQPADVDAIVLDQVIDQAAKPAALVDRHEAGQPPGDARMLDLVPRRCGIPLQDAQPAVTLALVGRTQDVGRNLTPVAEDHE